MSTEIAPLISSAVHCARTLNRMLVAELRALSELERRALSVENIISCAELKAGRHRADLAWKLQAGRDACLRFARDLRNLQSHLRAPE